MKLRLWVLLAASACAHHQSADPGSTDPALQQVRESDVRAELSALADDSMQGRATASVGSLRAARYLSDRFTAFGLVAMGDSGYLQRVPLARAARGPGQPALLRLLDSLTSRVPSESQRVYGYNVVGVVKGSDPALREQVVLVDAHYDHLGIGKPVAGDSIYNGADDDGSGVVAVLEIARALAQGPAPKRTVIFLATTGEEVGLLGTRWYIAHPVVPLEKMVANMEIEMIGRPDSLAGGPGKGWLTGFDRSSMGPSFKAAGLPIVADPRPDQQFFERSDNIAFARRGIPAHTLSSYNMHTDYHEPSDDVSRVDFAHMTRLIQAGVAAVRILADGPAPTWNPGGQPKPPQ
ncbi:MAG TPA: M20/M25/M40 family metallo-hydrolase [Gemmatimonadales bacterium]|nr:M20/M25/M40 family metallo-hydrolase [Gemmatimonadales bacterium]